MLENYTKRINTLFSSYRYVCECELIREYFDSDEYKNFLKNYKISITISLNPDKVIVKANNLEWIQLFLIDVICGGDIETFNMANFKYKDNKLGKIKTFEEIKLIDTIKK